MKPNSKIPKLLLSREIVRKLSNDELKLAAGGAARVSFTDCVSQKGSCDACSFGSICLGCGR